MTLLLKRTHRYFSVRFGLSQMLLKRLDGILLFLSFTRELTKESRRMMKDKIYLLGIAVLLLTACMEKRQNKTNYLVKETEIQQYNSDKLSDIVEYFDIVPLDTSDDCLLGEINVIKKRAGRYYIRTNDNRLDVFNENGKHLMKVGGVGQGPGEYTAICDFDADNDHIYILVPGKILKYDNNGTFQTELPIANLQWGHLRRIKNGFLIQCVQPLPDGNGLIYADDKGHVIQTAMSVGEHTHLKLIPCVLAILLLLIPYFYFPSSLPMQGFLSNEYVLRQT